MRKIRKPPQNIDVEILLKENESLRRQLGGTQILSKKQLEVEEKKLKLASRQLRGYQRQEKKQKRKETIQSGRRFIEKLAVKPKSRAESMEMFFGTKSIRNVAGRKYG